MRRLGYLLGALGFVGCGGGDAADADADAGIPAGDPLCEAAWIDVHMHCDLSALDCVDDVCTCNRTAWTSGAAEGDGRVGVVLSTEHFAVDDRIPAELKQANELIGETSEQEPSLLFAPSLECWHSKQFTDADWVDECKQDVDRWVAAGAVAFKDHVGKPFANTGADTSRWLGAWNRLNGWCDVPAAANMNELCMEQPVDTLRYPVMEAQWREVLSYIVETKQLPVVTHASDWPGVEATERCYDPYLSGTVELCHEVTQAHLLDLADWSEQRLSAAARRRIVVAHFGFLDMPDPQSLVRLLEAGLSVDTSARLSAFAAGSEQARELFETYPEQVLFGTDYKPSLACVGEDGYAPWLHSLTGTSGATRTFDGCEGPTEVTALGLPTEVQRNVLQQNFLRLLGHSCP